MRDLDPIFERPGRFFVEDDAFCRAPHDLMRILSEVLIFRACEAVFCDGTEYYGYSMLFTHIEPGSAIPCYRFKCDENKEIAVERDDGIAPRYMPPPSLARRPESNLDDVPEHHGGQRVSVGCDPEGGV